MYVIGSSTDEWQSYGAESTNQKTGFWLVQMLKQKTQSEFERKTILTGWIHFPGLISQFQTVAGGLQAGIALSLTLTNEKLPRDLVGQSESILSQRKNTEFSF